MELLKKQIHYTREGRKTFDQFYIDEDINVPDTKDDVKEIIQGSAKVKVEEVRPVENYICVSGKLYYQILYVTASEDPQPAVLEGNISFDEMVYVEKEERETCFVQNLRTEFTPGLVHSRKLSVRATVELELGKEKMEDEETTIGVEETENVYKKMRKVDLLELHTSKKDTYRIKEELVLPGTKESIGHLLLTDISSRKLEIRLSENEIHLKGEVLVFCMYQSEEEKTDWIEQTVPYEGKIECSDIDESMYFYVQSSLDDPVFDIRMDEDGEMRVLGIEATLNLRLNIYKEEEIELLEDMYSLKEKTTLKTKEAVYEELLIQNNSKCKITERLRLPELKSDVLQICHSEGSVQISHMEKTENGLLIDGILHLKFLYVKSDDVMPFGSWQGMVPFSYVLECPAMPENVLSNITYHVEQLSVNPAGSEAVEVKAVVAFDTFLRKPVPMQVITDVEFTPVSLEELEKRPGITGYIVREGDDLWKLAKMYMTTVDRIKEINDLESEVIKPGDKLLIFKESMMLL